MTSITVRVFYLPPAIFVCMQTLPVGVFTLYTCSTYLLNIV